MRFQLARFSSGLILLALLSGCGTASVRKERDAKAPLTSANSQIDAPSVEAQGMASWYGKRFHKRRTASGERFDMYGLTAAHRTLPFGSKVRIRNLKSGREVIVRINDRGPHSKGRLIDLSYGAAKSLGMVATGLAPVRIEVLSLGG